MRIKICGITRVEDAVAAIAAGADALGFIFVESSPRHITPAAAAAIIRSLPPFVAKVGVFVNASAAVIRDTAAFCGLDTLQFHGDESPAFCQAFAPLKTIKAFRPASRAALPEWQRYATDAWLLDSAVPGQFGGTGQVADWDLARAAARLERPLILAGGLNPENVTEAIRQVQPYAVDVSSGVEARPGEKDPAKLRAFLAAARAAGFALPDRR